MILLALIAAVIFIWFMFFKLGEWEDTGNGYKGNARLGGWTTLWLFLSPWLLLGVMGILLKG